MNMSTACRDKTLSSDNTRSLPPSGNVSFFSLPAELRNKVYRDFVIYEEPVAVPFEASVARSFIHYKLGKYRVNRLFWSEVQAIFYEENVFRLFFSRGYPYSSARIDQCLPFAKKLFIDLDGLYQHTRRARDADGLLSPGAQEKRFVEAIHGVVDAVAGIRGVEYLLIDMNASGIMHGGLDLRRHFYPFNKLHAEHVYFLRPYKPGYEAPPEGLEDLEQSMSIASATTEVSSEYRIPVDEVVDVTKDRTISKAKTDYWKDGLLPAPLAAYIFFNPQALIDYAEELTTMLSLKGRGAELWPDDRWEVYRWQDMIDGRRTIVFQMSAGASRTWFA